VTRPYSPEQLARRREETARWRERNRERLRAYNSRPDVLKRKAAHLRRRRRQDPEAVRAYVAKRKAEKPEVIRGYWRKFRAIQRAKNPHFDRDRDRAFRAANPNYVREYYARRRLRDAWLKFSTVCAANRREREVSP
jgi:hypothetical protein